MDKKKLLSRLYVSPDNPLTGNPLATDQFLQLAFIRRPPSDYGSRSNTSTQIQFMESLPIFNPIDFFPSDLTEEEFDMLDFESSQKSKSWIDDVAMGENEEVVLEIIKELESVILSGITAFTAPKLYNTTLVTEETWENLWENERLFNSELNDKYNIYKKLNVLMKFINSETLTNFIVKNVYTYLCKIELENNHYNFSYEFLQFTKNLLNSSAITNDNAKQEIYLSSLINDAKLPFSVVTEIKEFLLINKITSEYKKFT